MTPTTANRPVSSSRSAPEGVALRHRLGWVRRRLWFVNVTRGVFCLVAVLLTAAALAALLDWRWHLPGLVRAFLLVATLAGTAYVAFRYLLRPLAQKADDLSLALRIEERYPHLNDALASTVQFLDQQPGDDSSSPAMRREAVRRAMGKADGCDFGRVVDSRGLSGAGAFAAVAAMLAVALVFLDPTSAGVALARLADPFGAHDWPKQTQMTLDKHRARMGRNEPFDVRGTLDGVIPEKAAVVFRFDGGSPVTHTCNVTIDDEGVARFATRLDAGRVQRNFRFQVQANDAVSGEYGVEVLAPPTLIPLDGKPSPQLTLRYPSYTGLPSPQSLPPNAGNVEAVMGTGITLRARADRRLREAWVEYLPEEKLSLLSAMLSPLGATHPLAASTAEAAGQVVWARVPAVFEPDGQTFTIDCNPRTFGLYVLHFVDDTGLRNNRTFELRLRPDPAPTVTLERPSPTRDLLAVLPTATLSLQAVVEDTLYGIRSVAIEYRTDRNAPFRKLTLYDHAATPRGGMAPVAGLGILAQDWKLRPQRLELNTPLAIERLRNADGSPLREGQVVTLRLVADDFDDVDLSKAPGRSHEIDLRIIGKNLLDLILNQEQALVQQELLKLREKQRDAGKKVNEVENRLKKDDKLTPDDLSQLVEAEQLQQQVRERIGDWKEGLRAEVERILETLKQNNMPNSPARDRMNQVNRELSRIADAELQQIEPKLTEARKQAELLEEKARGDRREQLMERAKELEKQSKAAADAARDKGEKADKATNEAEAQRLRQEADDLKRKAQELQKQAERERRDAEQGPTVRPREALADARRGQEEVERTLNDLLKELEPWSNTREVKGEARQLLEEQKKALAELDELKDKLKDLAGLTPKDLQDKAPKQKDELDNLTEKQGKIEERVNQLLDKMKRLADRPETDPATAQELKNAFDEALKQDLPGQLKQARQQIQQNQLNQARKPQQAGLGALKDLVKNLEEKAAANLDRLTKKLKEAEEKLDELIAEQEKLRKKIQEAAKIPDAGRREQALKNLAGQQERLKKRAEEAARELARLRNQRAADQAEQAAKQMEDDLKRLSRGEPPANDEEALHRLDEAIIEIEQQRQKAEDALAREQLAKVAESIKALMERQKESIKETERIQQLVLQNKGWTRGLSLTRQSHANNQRGLGEETTAAVGRDLADTPVFARLLNKAVESMEAAAKAIEQASRDAERLSALEEDAKPLQQDALRRFEQFLKAVNEEQDRMARAAGGGGAGGGGMGGMGGDGGGEDSRPNADGIPPLAQLKLLRDMQKEVNGRTEAFTREHPDLTQLGAKDRSAFQAIRRDQKEVAELFDLFTRPAEERPKEGDNP